MKKLSVLIILSLFMAYVNAQKKFELVFTADQYKHFGAGVVISATGNCVTYIVLNRFADGMSLRKRKMLAAGTGFVGGILAAILKEIFDKINGGRFNPDDMAYTIVGSTTGVAGFSLGIRSHEPNQEWKLKKLEEEDIYQAYHLPLMKK